MQIFCTKLSFFVLNLKFILSHLSIDSYLRRRKVSYFRYRTIKDSTSKSGNGQSCWVYYDRMNNLLHRDQGTVPAATIAHVKISSFFSSPELKAQVSFSDHLSSVCPSIRPSVYPSVLLSVITA